MVDTKSVLVVCNECVVSCLLGHHDVVCQCGIGPSGYLTPALPLLYYFHDGTIHHCTHNQQTQLFYHAFIGRGWNEMKAMVVNLYHQTLSGAACQCCVYDNNCAMRVHKGRPLAL